MMSTNYFDFDNLGDYDVEKIFTNLQSCTDPNDDDIQYSNSEDCDGDDDETPITIYFMPLTNEDTIEHNKIHQQITNSSCSFRSERSGLSNNIRDLIDEDLYKFIFMPISKEISDYVRCRVKCETSGLSGTFSLEVECDGNGKTFCVLTAEKQLKITGQTQYTISVVPKYTDDIYSAELLSNSMSGTSYVLYLLNGNSRQELAEIHYEANFLGIKGPRKIEAKLHKFDDVLKTRLDFQEKNDMIESYSTERSNCFIHLHNKPPVWNPSTYTYKLSFNGKGRVLLPSVKNFQMVTNNEEEDVEQIVMQFGRMAECEFSCDFRYPLSLIQTFGIALSALESRLLRQ